MQQRKFQDYWVVVWEKAIKKTQMPFFITCFQEFNYKVYRLKQTGWRVLICSYAFTLQIHLFIGTVLPGNVTEVTVATEPPTNATMAPLQCRKDFYAVNSTCVPHCHSWSQYSDMGTLLVTTFEMFAATIGMMTSLSTLVLIFVFYREL